MKNCPRCGQAKPLDDFGRDRTRLSGRMSHCRMCSNAARKARYYANLSYERERNRDYYEATGAANRKASYDPAVTNQRYLAWKASHPDGLWEQWLKKSHRIRPDQWLALRDEQNGLCYLCELPLPDDRSKIHIDHYHACCGKKRSCKNCRRGLAHDYCNLLLGLVGEDPAALRGALAAFDGAKFVANFERARARSQETDRAVG